MLLFKEKIKYIDPLNVVFLCGSKYSPKSGKDKRIILKDFLSKNDCQAIILEEHFVFTKHKKGYLAYDDIFLKNLTEVEKLASLYADKIIIIHETISTAAEIGMLAGETALTSKICILTPDDISIEEDKMSYFIRLAFFNNYDSSSCKPKQIVYYPEVKVNRSSKNKSDYHTFFYENKIGANLGVKILDFVNKPKISKEIKFKRMTYDKFYLDNSILSYNINKSKKTITAYIHADTLKIQLLSMFTVESFRTSYRKEKPIKDHVTYLERSYKKLLLDTICDLEGLATTEYTTIQIIIADIKQCNLRQAIGYFLYMLQAIELIGLEQVSQGLNHNVRKIRISEEMDSYINRLKDYIHIKSKTAFGGMM